MADIVKQEYHLSCCPSLSQTKTSLVGYVSDLAIRIYFEYLRNYNLYNLIAFTQRRLLLLVSELPLFTVILSDTYKVDCCVWIRISCLGDERYPLGQTGRRVRSFIAVCRYGIVSDVINKCVCVVLCVTFLIYHNYLI